MSYCPEGVWRVAISSDKTLGWSDKTGRALSAKVEDKKNPTPQKNPLDKLHTMWYYNSVPREREQTSLLKNFFKKF